MGCKKKRLMAAILIFGVLILAGCQSRGGAEKPPAAQNAPGGPGADLSIEERLQRREAVAKLQRDQLSERIKQNEAIGQIVADDQKRAEKAAREQDLARFRKWCWWIGVGSLVLAVIAGALIIKLTGRLKLALSVAAALAGLGLLGFGVGWVLTNLTVVILIAAVLVVLAVVFKVWERYDELRDFAKIVAAKVDKASDYTEELAKAKIHNLDSFKDALIRIKSAT